VLNKAPASIIADCAGYLCSRTAEHPCKTGLSHFNPASNTLNGPLHNGLRLKLTTLARLDVKSLPLYNSIFIRAGNNAKVWLLPPPSTPLLTFAVLRNCKLTIIILLYWPFKVGLRKLNGPHGK
jgi:hypothetical protein